MKFDLIQIKNNQSAISAIALSHIDMADSRLERRYIRLVMKIVDPLNFIQSGVNHDKEKFIGQRRRLNVGSNIPDRFIDECF